MEKMLVALKIVGVAVLGFLLLVFVVQRRVVFPGTAREAPRPAATAPPAARQIWLDTSFGRVEAWFFEGSGDGPRPTLVFAHGNGELIDDWTPELMELSEEGANVLAVEFPGYGHSDGHPTRATIQEAFTVAFDALGDLSSVDVQRIVPYGRSLGGGAAAALALERPAAGLILQSTFASTMAMARQALVPGFLVRDRFDNRRTVAEFDGPILVMHGRADNVVPYEHAEALAAARADLEVTTIDCAHNDCARAWPQILAHVMDFLKANGLLEER